jgi:hypothetical protein
MAIKNRTDLKSYFVKNAIPTEGNFADLIESQLTQFQDGVFKLEGEPFSVVAAPGEQKRVLRLYANYPAANPDWMISLNPAQDPATVGTSRAGFGVTDGAGKIQLFVEAGSGRIGVGTNAPQFALDIVGGARVQGPLGFTVTGPIVPSIGNSEANGIQFPKDVGGGTEDRAFIRYFVESGETTKLLIGNNNDADDRISFYQMSGERLTVYNGFIGINNVTPGAALDINATSSTWGGWLEAIRFSRPEQSAITHPGGKLLFGLHGNRAFYFADTNAGRYVMTISGATGNVEIDHGRLEVAGGVKANSIGLGTTLHGATDFPYETIQMPPTHNLRLWYGTTERFVFRKEGNGLADGSWQSNAFDLAERFQNHEEGLEPGDVLALDRGSPERLVRTRSAQQDDIIGVVSERPGFVLGVSWEDPDAGVPLALAGRVPVKVNLEGGPIRIGDYLTSSSTAGVAMRTVRSGRVIGLAMQAFDGAAVGEGRVVVLVNPHWFGGR